MEPTSPQEPVGVGDWAEVPSRFTELSGALAGSTADQWTLMAALAARNSSEETWATEGAAEAAAEAAAAAEAEAAPDPAPDPAPVAASPTNQPCGSAPEVINDAPPDVLSPLQQRVDALFSSARGRVPPTREGLAQE